MPCLERVRRARATSSLDVPRHAAERGSTVHKHGTLFVVATPIGNLEDITLRALRVLREVSLVAAEDTRRTGNLLRHYEIRTRVLSVHAHNERRRTPGIVAKLDAGESVALVSDAGTPGISDPGAFLVQSARERGIRVEPVPGPSSVVAAISAAGRNVDRFAFLGFPPTRGKARKIFWSRVVALPDFLVVIFEAPHRAQQTLADLSEFVNRPITLARELTKTHEEFLSGTPADISARLGLPKGEITILIYSVADDTAGPAGEGRPSTDEEIRQIFGQITESGAPTRRHAVRAVAERAGLTPKQVYEALERAKISVK